MNQNIISLFLKIRPEVKWFLMQKAFGKIPNHEQFSEDLLQDIFIKLYQADIVDGKYESSHKNLIYTVAKNLFINEIRRLKVVEVERDEVILNSVASDVIEYREVDPKHKMLKYEIQNSKDLTKQIIELLLEGHKYMEISDILKMPLGTIKAEIYQFKQKLHQKYVLKKKNIRTRPIKKSSKEINVFPEKKITKHYKLSTCPQDKPCIYWEVKDLARYKSLVA